MNPRVRVLDLDTGGKKMYTLVFPEHADMSAKRSPSWHRWELLCSLHGSCMGSLDILTTPLRHT